MAIIHIPLMIYFLECTSLDVMAAELQQLQVESDLDAMSERLHKLQEKSPKRRKTSHSKK